MRILDITEYVDGRVHVEWETIADDGDLLIEGDYYVPEDPANLEAELGDWIETKREMREKINARPKPAKPRIKRTTRTLDDQARDRINERLGVV